MKCSLRTRQILSATNTFTLKAYFVYGFMALCVGIVCGLLNVPTRYQFHIEATFASLVFFTWCCSFSYFLWRIK
jgi:hypothetical protein